VLRGKFSNLISVCFLLAVLCCRVEAATLDLQGTNYAFNPVSIISTSRGFTLASNSMDNSAGSWEISLSDIDNNFNVTGNWIFTGNKSNTVQKIVALDDGLILLGNTSSSEGILKMTESTLQDIIVVRFDEKMRVRWSINLGGHGLNQAHDISISRQNGTVTILGWTNESGGEIDDHFGGWDIVVAQYNLDKGELNWVKTLGGKEDDIAGVLLNVKDSTYVCYNTWSDRHQWDIKLVQLNKHGRVLWKRTYGGKGIDLIAKLIYSQKGPIILGSTDSEDFIPTARGEADIFVMGLGKRGKPIWDVRFGGSHDEIATDIIERNKRLTIIGWSESNDIDVQNHFGGKDLIVLNLGIEDHDVHSYSYGTLDDDLPLQFTSMQDQFYVFGATKVMDKVLQPFLVEID